MNVWYVLLTFVFFDFMIIAIDGPVSAGKGSTSLLLAKKLGFKYIDSGSLYRVVAFYVFNAELDPENPSEVLPMLSKIDVKYGKKNGKQRVYSRGRDITDEVRYHAISKISSLVSVIPEVRVWVEKNLRKIVGNENIVVEGRDMTTVVFPNADVKFYLDATLEERAKRRHLEMKQRGENIDLERMKKDIFERDERDKNKKVGPLKIAPDAIYVDSTDMSIEEVVDFMYKKVTEHKKKVSMTDVRKRRPVTKRRRIV
ncbi:MAG: hypothetical protein ACD_63C00059G0003 [uncultured bacterium]|nr:MAG: hypothetical protein ACD_63C00059G0003 [uncultured bacterium]